jgi:hypothetical protein
MAEPAAPTVNELLLKAAEALDDAYDKLSGVTPEQYAFVALLQERSKDAFAGSDIFAPKDAFDPGKG